jgi:small-conductance mechanosensitive channel
VMLLSLYVSPWWENRKCFPRPCKYIIYIILLMYNYYINYIINMQFCFSLSPYTLIKAKYLYLSWTLNFFFWVELLQFVALLVFGFLHRVVVVRNSWSLFCLCYWNEIYFFQTAI